MNCARCGSPFFKQELDFYICLTCFPDFSSPPKPQPSITQEAEEIINGPRRESYGPIEESAINLANIWNSLLAKKLKEPITPRETMLMMAGLKLLRDMNQDKRDNRVDLIGYTLLADKLSKPQ